MAKGTVAPKLAETIDRFAAANALADLHGRLQGIALGVEKLLHERTEALSRAEGHLAAILEDALDAVVDEVKVLELNARIIALGGKAEVT